MPIILPVDDDLPPDEEEGDFEGGGEEEQPAPSPNPDPVPSRPSPLAFAKQNAPKKLKTGDSAPPSDEQSVNPFDESVSEEVRLDQPDDDGCLICKDGFNFPVVECLECKQSMCHICLVSWSKTVNARNGSGVEKVASCPNCRSNKGYQDNNWLNRKLGAKQVKCERCSKSMSQDILKKHITESCLKRKTSCKYQPYSCPWIGPYDAREEHQEQCMFANAAAAKAKVDVMKVAFQKELQEMRREKDAIMEDLVSTIEKGQKTLETQASALSGLQRAALHGEVSTFTIGRRRDTVSATMRSPGGRYVDLQVKIDLDADRFYSLHVSFVDPTARFPIWLALFLLNPRSKDPDSVCSVACFYFRHSKETFLLFSELGEGQNREELLANREEKIEFGIAGSVLFSGESRT